METIYNLLISKFQFFLAIAFRIGGLIFIAPFFGHRTIPFLLKVGLILLISLILLPITVAREFYIPVHFSSYLTFLVKEVLVGALIGFFFYLIFWGIEMGGNLLGLQLNLELNSPDEEMSTISRLQVFLGLLVFLALNGHHLLLSALFQSFELIPFGELRFSSLAFEKIMEFSASVFVIALKISAPVIVTLFIVDLSLGILGRSAPQSNLHLNFAPLRLGAGLLILALSFPIFGTIIEKLLLNTNTGLSEILKNLR